MQKAMQDDNTAASAPPDKATDKKRPPKARGTMIEVWEGRALRTRKGETREQLVLSPKGLPISASFYGKRGAPNRHVLSKLVECANDPVLLAVHELTRLDRHPAEHAEADDQVGGNVDAKQWADIKSKGVGYIPGIAIWEGVFNAPRLVSIDAIWAHPFEEMIARMSKQQKEYLKAHPKIYQDIYERWRKDVLEHLTPEEREAAEKQMHH